MIHKNDALGGIRPESPLDGMTHANEKNGAHQESKTKHVKIQIKSKVEGPNMLLF